MVTESRFSFVGGALCLDFVNTVGTRTHGEIVREKLRSREDLERWAKLAGVERPEPRLFRRAIALREALFRICEATVHGRAPRKNDMDLLNRELGEARGGERLVASRGGFRIEGNASFLAAVARSAEELLTSPELSRLRQCGGDGCGWVFLDTSRNGARQWCDMRICGNRAKARHFRERLLRERRRKA